MATAINLAARLLKIENGAGRVIFLVTDGAPYKVGKENPRDPADTIAAAGTTKKAGVDIMCLGTEEADHRLLRKLATRESACAQCPGVGVARRHRGLLQNYCLRADRFERAGRHLPTFNRLTTRMKSAFPCLEIFFPAMASRKTFDFERCCCWFLPLQRFWHSRLQQGHSCRCLAQC